MRKNTEQTLNAFLAGKACHKSESIWTDGLAVYSYTKPIASVDPENPHGFLVTTDRYSKTTTVHTNSVKSGLPAKKIRLVDELELRRCICTAELMQINEASKLKKEGS